MHPRRRRRKERPSYTKEEVDASTVLQSMASDDERKVAVAAVRREYAATVLQRAVRRRNMCDGFIIL
jgi:hypothetical protein